jgi:transposase
MDSAPTLCGVAPSELQTASRNLCGSLAVAAPRQFGADGRGTHSTYAESTRSDEPAPPPCFKHRNWIEWTGYSRRNSVGRTGPRLANLCHHTVRNSQETVAKALEGNYRSEHLFALRQSLDGYRYYQKLISQVDTELQRVLRALPNAASAQAEVPPQTKRRPPKRQKNEPAFDLRSELYRIVGVDLTDVPGISVVTAHTIVSEIGTDVVRFRNASAFASWLGLCPAQAVSGGKVLYTRSRKVKNRVAIALRSGAQCLYHAQNHLGEFYRRMKRKLGALEAVTATAHKLARIVYHMLRTKEAYSESVLLKSEEDLSRRAEARLRKHAAKLGFQVVPLEART